MKSLTYATGHHFYFFLSERRLAMRPTVRPLKNMTKDVMQVESTSKNVYNLKG